MKKFCGFMAVGALFVLALGAWTSRYDVAAISVLAAPGGGPNETDYTGSVSCRKCHEKFYQLWATSHHGLAMQPYTKELARTRLSPQSEDIIIEGSHYHAVITGETGWVIERGAEDEKKYRIDYALGGKNVYYFLTTMDRGRLQTLPLAYDVNKREWFDMAASGVRHFQGHIDEPVNWRNWQYTFNTACHGCHVSQISTNYDLNADTYSTTWKEPGINCETCHGPSGEHIRVCEAAPKGTVPKDLKITRGGRDFSHEQNNASCSSCHAKAVVLTNSFNPGDRFFDRYDLVALENLDYYPDGRDLGENYTYTSWIMSPCVKSGQLDCLHCHTSSGRYKFKADDKANQACMPCHQDKVGNSSEHTHHKADKAGNRCISCHMPTTEFARMRRTDHSMLPPSPAATIAFTSPNACNLCHLDNPPQWADELVRTWRKRDYQAPVLNRASLIAAARARDWTRLPHMLASFEDTDQDEVYTASLIRLLRTCPDEKKWPAVMKALQNQSPLVRGAAAESLAQYQTLESAHSLLRATKDDTLLVRIRAASALSGFPKAFLEEQDLATLRKATDEYLTSLLARPDQWTCHYNLGNFFLSQGNLKLALAAFQKASDLNPQGTMPLVNISVAHARKGDLGKAENILLKALQIEDKNAAANFNMGLLKAEQGDAPAAEKHLRAALASDPLMGEAAYNLGVLLAKDKPGEALAWLRKSVEIRPREDKYAYTLAFYEHQTGNLGEATRVLEDLTAREPIFIPAYLLLAEIYEKQGQAERALNAYRRVLASGGLPKQDLDFIEDKIRTLISR